MTINPKSLKNLIPAEKGDIRNPEGKTGVKIKPMLEKYLAVSSGENHIITGEELNCFQKATVELIKKATEGDIQAYKEIADRLEGKPQQAIDFTDKTNPLQDKIAQLPEKKLNEILRMIEDGSTD